MQANQDPYLYLFNEAKCIKKAFYTEFYPLKYKIRTIIKYESPYCVDTIGNFLNLFNYNPSNENHKMICMKYLIKTMTRYIINYKDMDEFLSKTSEICKEYLPGGKYFEENGKIEGISQKVNRLIYYELQYQCQLFLDAESKL